LAIRKGLALAEGHSLTEKLQDVVRGLDVKMNFLMSQYSNLLAVNAAFQATNSAFQADLALTKATIQALEADRFLLLNRLDNMEKSNALLTQPISLGV
jgi:hypothetical protein